MSNNNSKEKSTFEFLMGLLGNSLEVKAIEAALSVLIDIVTKSKKDIQEIKEYLHSSIHMYYKNGLDFLRAAQNVMCHDQTRIVVDEALSKRTPENRQPIGVSLPDRCSQ